MSTSAIETAGGAMRAGRFTTMVPTVPTVEAGWAKQHWEHLPNPAALTRAGGASYDRNMSHLEVDTGAVAAAGNRTAATASTWESWANRSESVLRGCASDVQDSTFSAALEGYLAQLNPALKSVARQVDALGANTVSAANTVSNSDTTANDLLRQQGHITDAAASALTRPINP
jgi:hypothetical protein